MIGFKWFRILLITLMVISMVAASGCITITAPDIGKNEQSGEPEKPPPFPPPSPNPTPIPAPAQAGLCDWTGTWQMDVGEMILYQTGNQVSGTYTNNAGRITGTVSGNILTGTWSEAPSYSPPNDAGDVEVEISADCNSLFCNLRYGSSGDWWGWDGTRIGTAPTPIPTPTSPPSQETKLKPNIELFDASPDTIGTGQLVTLNWSVTGAQIVSIDNGIGSVALMGSRAMQPAASTTFTLTATNEAGSVTATTSVTVIAATTTGNPVIVFTAVHMGGNSWQLNWNVTNSTEQIIEPEVGSVPPTGSTMITVPSGQTKTYRLTAKNSWGWAYWNVTLNSP